MSLISVGLPIVGALMDVLRNRKEDVAKGTGVSVDAVGKVGDMLQDYLSRDEKAMAVVMGEIDKARQHDIATSAKAPPIVELLRGIVRPLVTLCAFAWYVLARMMDIPLSAEDYTLIGGIVAFWFGFRSFEKR
ncbi:MAG: hypothetical protein WAZ18_07220 [Alphaproteobacteria bacterium]